MLDEQAALITEDTMKKMERMRDSNPQHSNEVIMQIVDDDDGLDEDVIDSIERMGK